MKPLSWPVVFHFLPLYLNANLWLITCCTLLARSNNAAVAASKAAKRSLISCSFFLFNRATSANAPFFSSISASFSRICLCLDANEGLMDELIWFADVGRVAPVVVASS
jgi:hypothetical protein